MPPINAVEKLLDICYSQVWWPSERLRTICLKPLHLNVANKPLEYLRKYVKRVHDQMEAIVNEEMTSPYLQMVNMSMIPVRF